MTTLTPGNIKAEDCADLGPEFPPLCTDRPTSFSGSTVDAFSVTDLTLGNIASGTPLIPTQTSAFVQTIPVYQIPSGNFELQEGCVDVLMATEQEIYDLAFEPDVGGSMILEADECLPISTASDGVPPGIEFMGSRKCAICGHLFKYKDLVFFRGAYYGIPCGDYNDIKGILSREADSRHLGSIRDEQRSR